MMSAAPTVKLEETSCKKLIRFLRTVLISVSSLIDATLTTVEVRSFGRLSENFKHMLSIHALNSVVISAIEKSINT